MEKGGGCEQNEPKRVEMTHLGPRCVNPFFPSYFFITN